MRNDKTKIIAIVVTVVLALFVGVDFWTGKAITIPATIESTDMDIRTSNSDDSFNRVKISYYAQVSSEDNMGIPINVSISSGQYKSLKYGDKVSLEISRGGITKIKYYAKVR
jgi:regulatory protein YycI of two-component signal transduction system YycFG